eukprot:scaffold382850_cov35-Prasinocladus_malaysianus.AAC.1
MLSEQTAWTGLLSKKDLRQQARAVKMVWTNADNLQLLLVIGLQSEQLDKVFSRPIRDPARWLVLTIDVNQRQIQQSLSTASKNCTQQCVLKHCAVGGPTRCMHCSERTSKCLKNGLPLPEMDEWYPCTHTKPNKIRKM